MSKHGLNRRLMFDLLDAMGVRFVESPATTGQRWRPRPRRRLRWPGRRRRRPGPRRRHRQQQRRRRRRLRHPPERTKSEICRLRREGKRKADDAKTARQERDAQADRLVGLDRRTDAHGRPLPREILDHLDAGDSDGTLNTDTLILVRIPNDTTRPATALSIPRDSYIAIPVVRSTSFGPASTPASQAVSLKTL